MLALNLDFSAKALRATRNVHSCIEFGANIGINLKAFKLLHPSQEQFWIGINVEASQQLATFIPAKHVYGKLVASTDRFLLVAEPYNPAAPVAIPYRGHTDCLFKRDFVGEIMERHPIMQLVDYGFAYRRDPNFPQDDITWFLMEKRS